MKITLEVSTETEATASPWWMIIDPKQNFQTESGGVHNIACMVTGPFFSRAEAEDYLSRAKHHFSKNAQVYCASGYQSAQYDAAYRAAWARERQSKKEGGA